MILLHDNVDLSLVFWGMAGGLIGALGFFVACFRWARRSTYYQTHYLDSDVIGRVFQLILFVLGVGFLAYVVFGMVSLVLTLFLVELGVG